MQIDITSDEFLDGLIEKAQDLICADKNEPMPDWLVSSESASRFGLELTIVLGDYKQMIREQKKEIENGTIDAGNS